jgi:hypothetical protein
VDGRILGLVLTAQPVTSKPQRILLSELTWSVAFQMPATCHIRKTQVLWFSPLDNSVNGLFLFTPYECKAMFTKKGLRNSFA